MRQAQVATAEAASGIQESLVGIREEISTVQEAAEGLAAAFAIDFLAEKVQSALEYSEAIKKVSEATGTTTTFVQQFTFAAGQAGVSTDTATAALEKFTISLGKGGNANQQTLKTLKDLGVTSTDTTTAILQLADGLEKVPTQSQKAADIVAVFGKGALSLLPVLESLAGDGFGKLAEQAEQLGVVLDGSVIDGAVNAEHKITALKGVLSADWANVIGQNATQIENLADALIKLTSAAANFASTKINQGALFDLNNPDLVRLKNLVTGGDTGAQLSGDAAGLMGSAQGRSMLLDRNTDQIRSLDGGSNGPAVGSKLYNQQRNSLLLQRKAILAADVPQPDAKPTPTPTSTLPPLKTPKGPKDRGPNQQATFDKQMGAEQQNQYSLQEQLATDPAIKANFERQQISYDYGNFDMATGKSDESGQKDQEIDDEVNTKKITAAQGDELKAELDKIGWLKIAVTNRQLDAQQAKDALALTTSQITNQEDVLNGDLALARTSADKKALNEQLIDLQNQQVAAQLDATIASKDSSATEIQIAQARKALLPTLLAQAKQKNANDNSGPLATYLNAMPKTVDEIGESLQTAAVDGLGSLTTGIEAAINGTGTLKSAFSSLATSIITDLEKVVIEEDIVKPLASLLGGSSGGGGILGSLAKGLGSALGLASGAGEFAAVDGMADSSISSIIASNPIAALPLPGRANGGVTAPGDYLTGERGPEIVSIGAPANVTPTRALNALGGGGASSVNVNATVSGVNDPAMVKRLSAQTIAAAAPALLRMASDTTMARTRARKMR